MLADFIHCEKEIPFLPARYICKRYAIFKMCLADVSVEHIGKSEITKHAHYVKLKQAMDVHYIYKGFGPWIFIR